MAHVKAILIYSRLSIEKIYIRIQKIKVTSNLPRKQLYIDPTRIHAVDNKCRLITSGIRPRVNIAQGIKAIKRGNNI